MTADNPSAGGAIERSPETSSVHPAAALCSDAGQLSDGTPVAVRPLVAEDRGLLVAGFSALSSRSRHSRFGRGVSDAQYARMLPVLLDSVDHQAHIAVIMYAAGRPIGVGRLRRYPADVNLADLAVTVADDWQGLGAGTVLAREVLARASGVREIHTVVAEDNPASLHMLARLGELRSDCIDGDCDVTVRVNHSPAATRPDAA